MNRNEEYNTLLRELDQTPPELEYTVTRAKARARRHQARRWVGVPVGTLAGAFAAFVLLVNTVPTFALACSHVPVLGDLAAAVDWSGSLSRAVEHDYVQVIGQSQTKDGITMAVEYVIVDQQQVNLFVCVENEDGTKPYTLLNCDIDAGDRAFSVVSSGQQEKNGELRRYIIDFNDKNQVPDRMTVTFGVRPVESLSAMDEVMASAPGGPAEETFAFDITFDPAYTASGVVYQVDRWLELDGQRICVEALEIYPTHARLKLKDSGDNSMWLEALDFYLEDEEGNRYEAEGGLAGYSDPVTGFAFDRRVASPWFAGTERLTLYVTSVSWLDPDRQEVTVDLVGKTAVGLPEGAALTGVNRGKEGVELRFEAPMREFGGVNLFRGCYFDPTGKEYSCTRSEVSTNDELDVMEPVVYLEPNYAYDTVTLRLNRTLWHRLDTPLAVEIK